MKAERLFRILGLVDESLIEEAVSASSPAAVQRRHPWRRIAAAAACLAVICGGVFLTGTFRMGSSTGEADGGTMIGESGDGHNAGTVFMSYAGPMFPLTTVETDTALTAERTVTWDFAAGTYEDGSPRQWGAQVTDVTVLTNPTDTAVTVTALYPFSGTLADLGTIQPAVTVDGEAADTTLHAGAYAGGFRDAGVDDGSTWNLDPPDSWEDYAALLEDGQYFSQALGETPALDIPVTVYRFSDFEAPLAEYDAATQAVEFTIDPEMTVVLSYGFNGLTQDTETGWRQYDYFVPDGIRNESEVKLLVVLGEDLESYTLQGYANGACEEEIDGVSCTVTREETTLDVVLTELCRAELNDNRQTFQWPGLDQLPVPLYQWVVTEALLTSGLLADTPADRYTDGRLDDFLWDVLVQERVLYLAFPVTVPAGGSVTVSAELWKEPSYDYGCSGSENVGLQGYDLVTALGSTLDFTSQNAALVNTDAIEIVRQNLGFDLENGVTEVTLDLAQPRYYLEIRPLNN